MQGLLIAPDGARAQGDLGKLAQDNGVVARDIRFAALERTPTGETIGLAFEFSDGSIIGAVLSAAEAQGLIQRLQMFLPPPSAPTPSGPPKLTLVLDPSKLH